MARKAGQGKEEEESRARQQREMPATMKKQDVGVTDLRTEPKASSLLAKCSATEFNRNPSDLFLIIANFSALADPIIEYPSKTQISL
ncbi:hypothetical protein STEG23_006747 [Scotinomys teguina]